MDNSGKPNIYGSCAGEDAGEDILQSLHDGGCKSYQGSAKILLQHLDQGQFNQIDVSKLTGKHYHQPALVSSGEVHHMAIEECLSTEASIVFDDYLRKAENKRKIDKAYRERCKMKKLQMEQDMVTFVEENKRLKIENESLKEKNASMNQILQSQRKELNEVKNIVENLKFENKKQNALAQILSDLLVNPDMCQENQKLKDENAQLTEMVKLSDEQLKIVKENGKLHHQNMLLKVQIDALCGKIVHENSKFVAISYWDKGALIDIVKGNYTVSLSFS